MMNASLGKSVKLVGLLGVSLWLGGCASRGDARDPLEGFNRAMFSFNETVDAAVFKPVAKGYDAVTPQPVQTGVGNFFGNIADLWIGANNLLQGKPADAVTDVARVAFNSVFGLLGLIDIASPMGLEKHDEDFGQTMGRWGVGAGPYVVLPVIGPRTARDTAGFVVDGAVDPVANLGHVPTRNSAYALRFVDIRAAMLPADKVIEEAALDKYSYVRDAYLQNRRSLVHDGNPPREPVSE